MGDGDTAQELSDRDTSERAIDLGARLGERLRERGWSCGTAESCTGGGIALAMTSTSGSSEYMLGGIVAYSNEAKMSLLRVRRETLDSVGAVSSECGVEMARGVRGAVGVDVGISSTGIAGPGGATARKPVGLVYIGVVTPEDERVLELHLSGDRLTIMREATEQVLALALQMLGADAPDMEHHSA